MVKWLYIQPILVYYSADFLNLNLTHMSYDMAIGKQTEVDT